DSRDAGQRTGPGGATGSTAPAPPTDEPRRVEPAADRAPPAGPSTDRLAAGSPAPREGAPREIEAGLAPSTGDHGCGSSAPQPAPPSPSGPRPAMGMAAPPRPLDVLGPLEGGWTSTSASSLFYHRDAVGLMEIPGHPGAEGEAVVTYFEDGTGMWRGTVD